MLKILNACHIGYWLRFGAFYENHENWQKTQNLTLFSRLPNVICSVIDAFNITQLYSMSSSARIHVCCSKNTLKICKNWIIVYHKLWLTNNRTMKIYARCLHCAGKNFNSVADRNAWRWSQTLSVCMNRMMIFDGAMAFISCMKSILLCVWMWQFASLGGEHHFIIIILNESWRIPLRMYAREWEQPLHNTIEMSAR